MGTDGRGLAELWAAVGRHRAYLAGSGLLERRRSARLEEELRRILGARLEARVAALASRPAFAEAVRAVAAGTIDPYDAADRLLAEIGAE